MSYKPASMESINLLYANMGRNFTQFTPLLCSFVDLYERLKQVDKTIFSDEFQLNELTLFSELIKLNIASMIINMDLSTFLRANFRSVSIIEKRCNLKYINVITNEGFKYFFGIKDDKKNAIWSKFKKNVKQIKDEDLNNDLLKVIACADEFESKYVQPKDSRSRNLSVHYDKNPVFVYNDIIRISENDEVKRANAFLAILEPLSFMISKYFNRNQDKLWKYFKSQKPYDLSLKEVINSFHDKSGELSIILDDEIIKFGKRIDKIIQSSVQPKLVASKLGLKSNFTKIFDPIVESIYPGLHLHFIFLDLACAIKAYLHAGYYFEKQMNLRRIRIALYEGFKKIYGFTSHQESNSFWRKSIYNMLHSSTDLAITSKLATVENRLNQLREYSDFKDDQKREYAVHYRYKEVDNMISIFHQLIDSNPVLEMDKAIQLLRLLPEILKLNNASLERVYKKFDRNISSVNNHTRAKIDNIISMVEAADIDEEMKKRTIESISEIKQYIPIK